MPAQVAADEYTAAYPAPPTTQPSAQAKLPPMMPPMIPNYHHPMPALTLASNYSSAASDVSKCTLAPDQTSSCKYLRARGINYGRDCRV